MAEFDIAIKITLRHEGGYVNNSEDNGGETNFGISKLSYPNLDIKNLTIEQAKQIYRVNYWNKIKGDLIKDQHLANKIFDIAVNCGVYIASKYIQLAAMEISKFKLIVDGIIGNKTISLINSCDAIELLKKFRELMLLYYESLNKPIFIRGWKIRLMSE